jgi:hypothetical protein
MNSSHVSASMVWFVLTAVLAYTPSSHGQTLSCDKSSYRPANGISATEVDNSVVITWDGENSDELRLRLLVDKGVPTIGELGVRAKGKKWSILGTNLKPDFRVVTGMRRLPNEQIAPLKSAGVRITPEVVEQNKWEAFWDAPLRVPGIADGPYKGNVSFWIPPTEQVGDLPGLPRKAEEIGRAEAIYASQACELSTNGARLEISFPGVTLGVFSGRLLFTVYKGSNLLRLEIVAKTESPSVAYAYDAGIEGLAISSASRLVWHDPANNPQQYQFGGPATQEAFAVTAANRLIAAELEGGAIAAFPPPHTFFWARELSVNLAYNWYRKGNDSRFGFGIRENEDEADPAYAGRGPADYRENFALRSARPDTWQHMPVYFYISRDSGADAIRSSLAFTRNDHYKPLPNYLVMVAHFHPYLALQLTAFRRGLATTLPDVEALKSAGVNVYAPSDGGNFAYGDTPGKSPVAGRPVPSSAEAAAVHVKNLDLYYQIARLHSDKDFWILPAEEITSGTLAEQLGGHHDLLVSHPVYWGQGREAGQALSDSDPKYGKVYHIGTPADLMEMAHRENLLVYLPHPRSKASAGYPDAIKDTQYFRDQNYGGIGFRWGMGIDGSERRLCEYRCLPVLDDMNNWTADLPTPPKYLEAISETHMQAPGDDVYANNPVTYLKVTAPPRLDNWAPIIDAMKRGHSFVTSGEVLLPSYAVEGSGNKRTVAADVEWTFPLEFVEAVWGDGQRIDRQVISATDLPAFGKHHFEIPFDATGKKWIRFAAWDSAGNGALSQPVKLWEGEKLR